MKMSIEDALRQSGISESDIEKAMNCAPSEPGDENSRCMTQQDMEYLKRKLEQPPKPYIWRRKKKR